VANNNPYNVKTELTDGIDSMARFSGSDGGLHPQRLVLHELIAQIVSERRILPLGQKSYGGFLERTIKKAQALESYQKLEKSGDYTPEKISAVLDELGLERLPVHDRAKQVMMITGGPGTGKSSLVDEFAKAQPEIYQSAVQINPDDYKNILARPKDFGALHSEYTHKESAMIAQIIMGRLDERMAAGLPAPHVMMDVVSPNPMRMAFAARFEQMKVSHGTAPAEVTLQRAYERGFDADGNIHGRVISSRVVLDGTAKASELLPNIFEHPNLEFKMIDTNVSFGEKRPVVAEWHNDAKRLAVYDPDAFVDFVQRQHINTNATHAGELWQGFEPTPERLATDLKPYTDKGVQIDFMDSDKKPAMSLRADRVEVHGNLPSKHGPGFMADMAETFGRMGKNGGFIAGTAFGTLAGAFTLAAGGSAAAAAEAVYEGAIPYGETQIAALRGDEQSMKRSATVETVSNIGAAGGALAGAAIGTMILPGVDTAVGAAVGGIGAGIASGEVTALVYDNFAAIKGRAVDLSSEAAGALNAAARKTANLWNRITGSDAPNISLEAFNGLPGVATDDMPPEVVSLIELKQSPALFKKQFESLREDGSLDEVAAYIKDNPLRQEIEPAYQHPANPQKIHTASLSF